MKRGSKKNKKAKNHVNMAPEVKSVIDILKMPLSIPNFQRPYRWKEKNVCDLLEDISFAIEKSKEHKNYKYRIGTLLLCDINQSTNRLEIIDGQQRLITLLLITLCFDPNFKSSLLDSEHYFEAKQNIISNYSFIKNWVSSKNIDGDEERKFQDAFKDCLEMVVIKVDNLPAAFRLFDSQNMRGRPIDPPDLLKAYHLREMANDIHEKNHAVEKWEDYNPEDIRDLFQDYLFPVLNWSKKEKSHVFSVKDIDVYKGVSEQTNYYYGKRAAKAEPYFQINEPFCSGNGFFSFVSKYLSLKGDVENEINIFKDLKRIIGHCENGSTGFGYAYKLFKCVLLFYYDRFHNFDKQAVNKLFTWSFMLRVDMRNLGLNSVNKYAVGGDGGYSYTNNIPMFFYIANARQHKEICNLFVTVKRNTDSAADPNWDDLYEELKRINGIGI